MTPIEIPEAAVEAACAKLAIGMEFERNWPEDYQDEAGNELRAAMREALAAAVPVMFERVGIVCMNGRRYGHGLFADIEVQYPTPQTGGPSIGTVLYGYTPTQEASGEPKRAARPSRGHNLVCSRCESKFSSDDQDADLCGICEADEQLQPDMDRDRG